MITTAFARRRRRAGLREGALLAVGCGGVGGGVADREQNCVKGGAPVNAVKP